MLAKGCSTRMAQPRAGKHDSDLRELRSGVHVRDGGGAGGHTADVREGDECFYYITMYNETTQCRRCRRVLRRDSEGIYKFRTATNARRRCSCSGVADPERVLRRRRYWRRSSDCGGRVERDQLHGAAEGGDCDRALERLHPAEAERTTYIELRWRERRADRCASDYMKSLPDFWLRGSE